jgi:hypothetical protein
MKLVVSVLVYYVGCYLRAALLRWIRALVRKSQRPTVTQKGVTAGDAPEDNDEASETRRNTVSMQAYTHTNITYTQTCTQEYIHTSTIHTLQCITTKCCAPSCVRTALLKC